jgi:hypothetical protein
MTPPVKRYDIRSHGNGFPPDVYERAAGVWVSGADYDALAAQMAVVEAEHAWRPIETAPKGGGADITTDPTWVEPPFVLLRFPAYQSERHSVARWDWYYAESGAGYDPRYGVHGAWIEPCSGERLVLHYDPPTHWLPLPAPPAATTSEKE